MRYGLAIFDFDGTLADSTAWFLGAFNELAAREGFRQVSAEEFDRLRGAEARTILRNLGIPLRKVPSIAMQMRALGRRDAERIELYDGIPHALRQLAEAGVSLGIVSSNARDTIERVLGADLAARIDHWSCGASLFGKASRLARMVRKCGLPLGSSIYVGDEVRDAKASREAGLAFGAVSWGYNHVDRLEAEKPELVFASVGEIAPGILGG